MTHLFEPIQIGDLKLPNRIIMAPLTRCRADEPGRVPNALMAEYYAQRASAGMIISEATSVTAMGVGYPATPGIWSKEQIAGWQHVTQRVHEKGGRILLQLWHVGRISDPVYLNGALPIAPSAIAAKGHVSLLRPKKDHITPRALEVSEIPEIIEAFYQGAKNAKTAGFDGVEIHGANGYLLDQFLQDGTNKRTDQYGGIIQNRARLMLEVVDAVNSVWTPGRVGLHLSPRSDFHSIADSNPAATFGYVAQELGKRKNAFLCTRESITGTRLSPQLKKLFGGAYIANEQFSRETAENIIASGEADAVAFGQLFIANPDLPLRFTLNAPLNKPDPDTFYFGGAKGYTDYPTFPTPGVGKVF
jgi:N-ethylmaleimide reductase